MAVEIDGHQMLKVWVDENDYRVLDTVTSPTVADVAQRISLKLDVSVDSFDMFLEVALCNGDKSVRKMDEDEVIQNTLDRHKSYNTRVMLSPKSNYSD